jgi:hypothetical protein
MEDLVENDGMKNKFVGNVVKIIIKCNTWLIAINECFKKL